MPGWTKSINIVKPSLRLKKCLILVFLGGHCHLETAFQIYSSAVNSVSGTPPIKDQVTHMRRTVYIYCFQWSWWDSDLEYYSIVLNISVDQNQFIWTPTAAAPAPFLFNYCQICATSSKSLLPLKTVVCVSVRYRKCQGVGVTNKVLSLCMGWVLGMGKIIIIIIKSPPNNLKVKDGTYYQAKSTPSPPLPKSSTEARMGGAVATQNSS